MQLVEWNCLRCGERIASLLDAHFCPDCESPVHYLCVGPPDGPGCPTCGAPVPAVERRPSEAVGPQVLGPAPWPWRLRLILTDFYTWAVAIGVRSARSDESTVTDLLMSVAMAIALGLWAIADARARRRPIPLLARSWFFIFAVFLVPAYVVWSRGWRGLAWLAVHTAGGLVVAYATAITALVVVEVLKP